MTLDLDVIRQRHTLALTKPDANHWAASAVDVPALLAEVEGLRTENAEQARLLEYLDGAVAQSLDMVDEVERLRGIIAEAKAATIERGADDAFWSVVKTHNILKRAEEHSA